MLRIHKSYNGKNAVVYFDAALSKEGEYYTKNLVKAYWDGKTAEILGLSGKEVTRDDFAALVGNRNPGSGDRLTVRDAANRRAGFDFVFSAPKSVSVLYFITKDERIMDAHRKAYTKTIKAIEADMQTQANTADKRVYQNTGNLAFAAFNHFTSRPNEIYRNGQKLYAPDPQIHAHCFVPNVTWNSEKQRFQAIETGNIFRMAPFFEAHYHALLSYELQRCGYAIERTEDRYEIKGVSRNVIERYSNRTKTVNKVAAEKGITNAKKKSELGALTRHSKGKSVDKDEMEALWLERLSVSEQKDLKALKGKYKGHNTISAKEAVDRSLDHFLERNSIVQEKKMLARALTLGYGHLLPEDVQQELDSRDNIIRSNIDTVSHITTREMVRAEDRMIELAVSAKGKFPSINPDYRPEKKFLNGAQKTAIRELLSSNDGVTVLKGAAGTGKSTLLSEVRTGIQKDGKRVFAVAPSTQAAQLLKKEGFEADTVAALLHNSELLQKIRGGVLIVDEAGMIGTKQFSRILELVTKQKTMLVLSGDTLQHSPPAQHGDALRILETQGRLKTVVVREIVRQKPADYKKAVTQLARGRTAEGYNVLGKNGTIKEVPDNDERLEAIANEYISTVKAKSPALVISPTHAEAELITEIVRDRLMADGKLKGKERSFITYQNLSLTEDERKDFVNYSEGQVLRFISNVKGGFKGGSHYEVIGLKNENTLRVREHISSKKLSLPLEHACSFNVYRKATIRLAEGDTIRITCNVRTLEKTKISNGTRHKVKGFNGRGDILLESGKTLSGATGHFRHGIVETSFGSQGKSSRNVIVSVSDMSLPAVNDQTFYVSASRGTHNLSVYTQDKAELKQAVLRSGARTSARKLAADYERHLFMERRKGHYKTAIEKARDHGRQRQNTRQPQKGVYRSREL